MTISTVLFDADGVIQTWNASAVAELKALVPASANVDQFLQDIFKAEAPCLRGDEDFRDALAPLLERWNVVVPLDTVLALWHRIDAYPGMVASIERLKQYGLQCHLATNQQTRRAAYMRSELNYDGLFHQSFYSCDLRVAKPDPDYFRVIVDRLGTDPANILFIDDRADNTAAAVSVGIQGLQFNAREQEQPNAALVTQLQSLGVLLD